MTKILIFFLVAILIILIIIGIAVKSFRTYLDKIFQNFEIQSKKSKEQTKNKVIYEKNGIVVMKGEADKQKNE